MFINRKHTEETKEKIRISLKGKNSGNKNGMWKDKPGMTALHGWIKLRLAKPLACNNCGEVKPLDLANISQEYKRDLSDWEWLCRKCHMTKDGRLFSFPRKRKYPDRICGNCSTSFPPINGKRKYCKLSCYTEYRRRVSKS